jgi:hypothetical protein
MWRSPSRIPTSRRWGASGRMRWPRSPWRRSPGCSACGRRGRPSPTPSSGRRPSPARRSHPSFTSAARRWEVPETEPGEWREAAVPRVTRRRRRRGTTLVALGMVPERGRATRAATPTWACSPAVTMHTAGCTSILTVDRLRHLLPDLAQSRGGAFRLPAAAGVNFVIHRLLDEGVASTLRVDPQAKGLGEYLRAKLVESPSPSSIRVFSGAGGH